MNRWLVFLPSLVAAGVGIAFKLAEDRQKRRAAEEAQNRHDPRRWSEGEIAALVIAKRREIADEIARKKMVDDAFLAICRETETLFPGRPNVFPNAPTSI